MKRFKFTLQSLLNVKSSLEKQKQNQLIAITNLIENLKQELENIKHERVKKERDLAESLIKGTEVSQLALYTNYFEYLKDCVSRQLDKIAKAQFERIAIQKELVKLMKERKMLEKLKEKQYQEYLIEVYREEEKMIGDLISYKVGQQARGEASG